MPPSLSPSTAVHCRTLAIDGHQVFYREAGAEDAPVVLMLHDFPTSSHMYRDLIPVLSGLPGTFAGLGDGRVRTGWCGRPWVYPEPAEVNPPRANVRQQTNRVQGDG